MPYFNVGDGMHCICCSLSRTLWHDLGSLFFVHREIIFSLDFYSKTALMVVVPVASLDLLSFRLMSHR